MGLPTSAATGIIAVLAVVLVSGLFTDARTRVHPRPFIIHGRPAPCQAGAAVALFFAVSAARKMRRRAKNAFYLDAQDITIDVALDGTPVVLESDPRARDYLSGASYSAVFRGEPRPPRSALPPGRRQQPPDPGSAADQAPKSC